MRNLLQPGLKVLERSLLIASLDAQFHHPLVVLLPVHGAMPAASTTDSGCTAASSGYRRTFPNIETGRPDATGLLNEILPLPIFINRRTVVGTNRRPPTQAFYLLLEKTPIVGTQDRVRRISHLGQTPVYVLPSSHPNGLEPILRVSQSRSLNTFTPPTLPGSPVFPVDGRNRRAF